MVHIIRSIGRVFTFEEDRGGMKKAGEGSIGYIGSKGT
jgi:hypothetical protein